MGHHLTADGQFKSDRHPDLPVGKIVLSFKDPHAQIGLWVTALDYRAADPELSEDMVTALNRLGSAPPRCFAEDAWAQSIARQCGVDPRRTARVFVREKDDQGNVEVHLVGDVGVIAQICTWVAEDRLLDVVEHALVAGVEGPPRSAADDGRPDFQGFLDALRGERAWSAMLHSGDKTGQAATDQRALHELALHVQRVGEQLGFLPVRLSAGGATSSSVVDVLDREEASWEEAARLRTMELPEWLRRMADTIADKSGPMPGQTRADIVARLNATADVLREDPLGSWMRAMAVDVGNGRLPKAATDSVTVEKLRAAADAVRRIYPLSLAAMEANDAPLLAPELAPEG